MQRKYFTLQEANELLPTLEVKLSQLLRVKKQIALIIEDLQKRNIRVEDLFSMTFEVNTEYLKIKKELEKLGTALNAGVSQIHDYGCIVKDLDLGLIDFYTLYEGQELFYCWQLGEDKICYWHGVTEGFSNRRSLFEDNKNQQGKVYH